LGDADVQFKLLDCESIQITTVGDPSAKETTLFKLVMGQGGISQNSVEEAFCNPFTFTSEWNSERNPQWNDSSPDSVPKFIRNYSMGISEMAVFFKPEQFVIASEFFASHVKAFRDTCTRLMQKVEGKVYQPAPIVIEEDATVVAQGLTARNESPNNVNALRKALEASQKIVKEADTVQFELSTQNAELQMKNMELETKLASAIARLESTQLVCEELQQKLINLQISLHSD